MNLENVGGRILVMEEMNCHRERMKHVKSVISIAPPWGHIPTGEGSGRGASGRHSESRPNSAYGVGGTDAEHGPECSTGMLTLQQPLRVSGYSSNGGSVMRAWYDIYGELGVDYKRRLLRLFQVRNHDQLFSQCDPIQLHANGSLQG